MVPVRSQVTLPARLRSRMPVRLPACVPSHARPALTCPGHRRTELRAPGHCAMALGLCYAACLVCVVSVLCSRSVCSELGAVCSVVPCSMVPSCAHGMRMRSMHAVRHASRGPVSGACCVYVAWPGAVGRLWSQQYRGPQRGEREWEYCARVSIEQHVMCILCI